MSNLFPHDRLSAPTVPDLSDQIECTTELIGRGGCGSVYKGRWLGGSAAITTPTTIAIKIIDLVPLKDEGERKRRFKLIARELSLWCSIQHENILPLLGIARINGDTNIPAFMCPWMENGNAKEFCSRNPRFPPMLILYDIINGLHYLHTSKPEIVHGDIKAVNVLINNRCEACLCDFGPSRFLNEHTFWKTTAAVAGSTARWMAPELMSGDASTPTRESDIYSYAMTCYEILSGDVPFKSVSTELAVLLKITKGERPARMESLHSDFMWDIITQCWKQEPKDRLPTEKVLGLFHAAIDRKEIVRSLAKIEEKDILLMKVEKHMTVLKMKMAKAEADMVSLKEEKEKALEKAEEELKEKDIAMAVVEKEVGALKERMAVALSKAEDDMKALREEKDDALERAEEEMKVLRKERDALQHQLDPPSHPCSTLLPLQSPQTWT